MKTWDGKSHAVNMEVGTHSLEGSCEYVVVKELSAKGMFEEALQVYQI